ncbi:MAG: hypothetical protein QOI28_678 [Mycobacterium sp.]|nr:hypothetical protein [Mycobacterium sp.]
MWPEASRTTGDGPVGRQCADRIGLAQPRPSRSGAALVFPLVLAGLGHDTHHRSGIRPDLQQSKGDAGVDHSFDCDRHVGIADRPSRAHILGRRRAFRRRHRWGSRRCVEPPSGHQCPSRCAGRPPWWRIRHIRWRTCRFGTCRVRAAALVHCRVGELGAAGAGATCGTLAAARAGTPACTSMKCGVPVGRRIGHVHPYRRGARPPGGAADPSDHPGRARRRDRRAPPNRR